VKVKVKVTHPYSATSAKWQRGRAQQAQVKLKVKITIITDASCGIGPIGLQATLFGGKCSRVLWRSRVSIIFFLIDAIMLGSLYNIL
jgi:hypothetical protein